MSLTEMGRRRGPDLGREHQESCYGRDSGACETGKQICQEAVGCF